MNTKTVPNNISTFSAKLKNKKPLLGLDIGEKTLGIAISDSGWKIASPLKTIKRRKFTTDAEELIKIIKEHDVSGLVAGLPVNMDGTEGGKCQSVRQFARNLQKLYEIPVFFQDERMSTKVVTDMMIEADLSRERRKELVDKMAACYILQSALDRIKN